MGREGGMASLRKGTLEIKLRHEENLAWESPRSLAHVWDPRINKVRNLYKVYTCSRIVMNGEIGTGTITDFALEFSIDFSESQNSEH